MLEWLFGKKKEEPKPNKQKEKKKKKSEAEQETQDRWQYQFLLQFLNSPLWRVSILDFVDQHCLVFDNQEVNKFEYTKIHNQFKELVGNLFDGMMQQIGLDDEKLVVLLEKGFQSKQKKLFNQLLLCDDFLKFKELMLKRNKALEDEAIKAMNGQQRRPSVIQVQRNAIHASMKQQEARRKKLQQQEQEMLRKVMQQSRLQAEETKAIQKLSQKADNYEEKRTKQLQQQRVNAKKLQQQRIRKIQQQRQQARKNQQKQKQEQEQIKRRAEQKKAQIMKKRNAKNTGDLPPLKNTGDLPPLKNPAKKEPQFESSQPIVPPPVIKQQIKQQQAPKLKEQVKQQAQTQSTQQRKKRLLEQRQKIRKKKQQERRKMLEQQEQQNRKVDNIVLQDSGIHDSQVISSNVEPEDKISKQQIQRRKQLMKKIKNRIVQDF